MQCDDWRGDAKYAMLMELFSAINEEQNTHKQPTTKGNCLEKHVQSWRTSPWGYLWFVQQVRSIVNSQLEYLSSVRGHIRRNYIEISLPEAWESFRENQQQPDGRPVNMQFPLHCSIHDARLALLALWRTRWSNLCGLTLKDRRQEHWDGWR